MDKILENKISEYQRVGLNFLIMLKDKKYSYAEMLITLTLMQNVLNYAMYNDQNIKDLVEKEV